MGMWWFGSYIDPRDRSNYGCMIFADTHSQANYYAAARGIGESLSGANGPQSEVMFRPPSANMLLPQTRSTDVVHALSWLGNLAIMSRACTVPEVLSDTGFIHEYAHFLVHDMYSPDAWLTNTMTVKQVLEEVAKWKQGGPAPVMVRECAKAVAAIEKKIPGFLPY